MSFIFLKNAQIELTTDCVHRADVVCTSESLEGPQVESPADSSSPLGCKPRQPPPPSVSTEAPQPWTLHETAQAVWPVFNVLQSLREAGLSQWQDTPSKTTRPALCERPAKRSRTAKRELLSFSFICPDVPWHHTYRCCPCSPPAPMMIVHEKKWR